MHVNAPMAKLSFKTPEDQKTTEGKKKNAIRTVPLRMEKCFTRKPPNSQKPANEKKEKSTEAIQ